MIDVRLERAPDHEESGAWVVYVGGKARGRIAPTLLGWQAWSWAGVRLGRARLSRRAAAAMVAESNDHGDRESESEQTSNAVVNGA